MRLIWLLKRNFLVGLCVPLWTIANTAQATDTQQTDNFIMRHISDAHEWHFVTIGSIHVTLPLPIILFSQDRGVEVFFSNRFYNAHHHRVPYQGYKLDEQDKIVSVDTARTFYDISITKNVASMLISIAMLISMILMAAQRYRKNPYTTPRGWWALLEWIIVLVKDQIAIPNIGKQQYRRFMPYLLTIFVFIWLNNLMGLLPGAANVTGNITVTLALALSTFLITNINANKRYWKHVFCTPGVPVWLTPIMIPIELIGLLTKPISLAVRLFANITAGHIILLSIISLIFTFQTALAGLISVPFGAFMFLLKLMVSFLQAYIFTLLSAIYFGAAVENH